MGLLQIPLVVYLQTWPIECLHSDSDVRCMGVLSLYGFASLTKIMSEECELAGLASCAADGWMPDWTGCQLSCDGAADDCEVPSSGFSTKNHTLVKPSARFEQ